MPSQRRGRRPGLNDTRGEILAAARRQFAVGYDSASIRSIAADAEVDPALVMQYFGSKAGLFLAAMESVMRPEAIVAAVLEKGKDSVGARLATHFFSLWDSDESRYPLQSMLVSATSHPPAASLLRQFITEQVLIPVAHAIDAPRARLRATLCGSQLVGAAMLRYVYEMPELARISTPHLVRILAPVLDHHLSGPLPRPSRRQEGSGR